MSAEDSPESSTVSLKEHMEALLAASDLRYSQRFDASKVSIDLALASAEKAVQAALAAADRAVTKSEASANERFASVNEFRATLADQQRTLMPRAEAELMIKMLSEKLDL